MRWEIDFQKDKDSYGQDLGGGTFNQKAGEFSRTSRREMM